MTKQFNIEKRLFQLVVGLLAFICLVPGGAGAFGGINASAGFAGMETIFNSESALRGFVDNQYRFGFGIFFTMGLMLVYALQNLKEHVAVFRFAVLAIFIGGIGRALNIIEFGVVDDQVVGPTVIELGIGGALVALCCTLGR